MDVERSGVVAGDACARGTGPAGRGGGTLLRNATGDGLLYFGGYNDSLLADFWALDARGWRRLAR